MKKLLEDTMTVECKICCFIAKSWKSKPVPQYNTILFESEYFVAVPTKSPIVEGWLIVFPKQHYLSLADLPPSQLQELSQFSISVKHSIEQHYSKCVMVEQGSIAYGQPTGCGVDHAHLHIIPMDIDTILYNVNQILETNAKHWLMDVSLASLPKIRKKYRPCYFYIADGATERLLIQRQFPRQLLRQAITHNSPNEHSYDWNLFDYTTNLQQTIITLEKNGIKQSIAAQRSISSQNGHALAI